MGGYGSGRRWTFSKKDTVEDGLTLSVFKMARDGLFVPGQGVLTWKNTRTGEKTGSIGYKVKDSGNNHYRLHLDYQTTRHGEKDFVEMGVEIAPTRPNFGGVRFWFICPLVIRGRACNKRVGKLHLPPGGKYFGCRHCLDLTYTSSQTHNKRWDFLNRLMKGKGTLGIDKAIDQFLGRKRLKWS